MKNTFFIILVFFSSCCEGQLNLTIKTSDLTIVGSGQSGMVNRACPNSGGEYAITDSRVKSFNTLTNVVEVADQFNTHDLLQNPVFLGPNNNQLSWSIAKQITREYSNRVNLVNSAKGSRSITEWAAGFPQYNFLVDAHTNSGFDAADIFVWHQGEDDNSMNVNTYKTLFLQLINDLIAAGVLKPNVQIIVGQLKLTGGDNMNTAFQQLADENTNIEFAKTTNQSGCDNFHYSGEALDDLAESYFDLINFALFQKVCLPVK